MRHFAPTFCFEIDQEFEFFIETSLINNVAKSLNFYLFILQTGDSMDIVCGLSPSFKAETSPIVGDIDPIPPRICVESSALKA